MSRTLPLLVAVASVAALLTGTTTSTAAPTPPTDGRTVTLVTGDRVRVGSDGVLIEPGQARRGTRFSQYRVDGHDYVIPSDALAMVGAGRLDRRLFDVTTLLEMGYDDSSRPDLPLIVTGGRVAAARTATALPSVDGAAVRLPVADRTRFWSSLTGPGAARDADRTIWLDGMRKLHLDQSVPQVGGPAAWQAGYTGRGVTVAVLDTGVDADHPDLAGRVADVRDFTGEQGGTDRDGHGTHVASTIAGSGAASGGRLRGMAPEATLLSGKVCSVDGCPDSAVLAGMEWAARSGAAVVNLSLGGPDGAGLDPLEQAVNALTEQHGTLFVISAGNAGTLGAATVGSPGSAEAALTVGAVDRQNALAPFSSRGPRIGDEGIKPDLTAPGVEIQAAQATGTGGAEPYVRMSGTSMAAPHVTGAAALLAEQHPGWDGPDLKTSLTGAAEPAEDLTPFEQGSGRLDVARAVSQTMRAEPANLSLGRQRWPHDDDEPVTRPVTVHNDGDEAVTMTLSVDATGPDGRPAPDGAFRVLPTEITVGPGAAEQVTVTVDTRVPGPEGTYSGAVVATGGQQRVRVPLVVNREPESYDLTLTHLDRTGASTPRYGTSVYGVDASFSAAPYEPDGTSTVRLPKGHYHVDSAIVEADDSASSKLVHPLVDLAGDTTVSLDARTAIPVEVTVPRPAAIPFATAVGYTRRFPGGDVASIETAEGGAPLYSARVGPAQPVAGLTGQVLSWWGELGPDGRLGAGSHLFNLAWYPARTMPSGYTRHVREEELAVVRAEYRSVVPGASGRRTARPRGPGMAEALLGLGTEAELPMTRTEYYTTDDVEWSEELLEVVDGEPREEEASYATTYRRGPRTVVWGAAPFGPSLPRDLVPWVYREGDLLGSRVKLFGDREHNRAGWSIVDSEHNALYVDGSPVPENGRGTFAVPPRTAEYRLEVGATRSGAYELSTSVSLEWTFTSAHVPEGRATALPVSVIRYTPELDATDTAPAGRRFTVPVLVQRQPGATTARTLRTEVSYDDGRTWQPAHATGRGDHWRAVVNHPSRAGFVSLRTTATDHAGGSVTYTVIRAYRIG
ncbi:S8 family serine peptidase [Actinophytocola xanthii]|uniref:Peptidase S8/S53 domain-containing protein n=1 Tax=Actinophytocola xanthii TaxID=1912961 RepID=A0A1Q8C687_9PSEU|nr:S8 family serine peptidase [Actinophytocola xanthii]OLF09875.1 hypothetical protein BU204_32545 [Actinophytocola xanthii]